MKYDQLNLMLDSIENPELESLLSQYGRSIRLPARRIFSVPGDELDGLIYIKEGLTRHYMMNDEGTEKLLYQLPKGWFFGEVCCWTGVHTGLYSQADDDVLLQIISYADARTLFDTSPCFRNAILKCLIYKTLILRNEVETITFLSCKKRIQRLFLAAIDDTVTYEGRWHPLKIQYTHAALGSIVGASRVTISKVINEMRGDQFLRTVNQQNQIDPTKAG